MTKIHCGILAFQGDVEEHEAAFLRLGVKAERILTAEQLENLTHLVIPGGESTVMSQFLKGSDVQKILRERVQTGQLAVFGTCAGAILLSKNVQPSEKIENMGLIDLDVDRNAYGSQLHSFEEEVEFLPEKTAVNAVFIRAPRFTRVGEGVEILAYQNGTPILVQQKNVLATSFHPEYLENPIIHNYFLQMEVRSM